MLYERSIAAGVFEVSWHETGRIAAICLNRPPANALGLSEINDLTGLLAKLTADPDLCALIFYSRLRFFSAGADIAFMRDVSRSKEGPEELARFSEQMQTAFAELEALPLLTISAISGICVGGGLELALSCDLRVVERDASLGLPEIKIGLLPGAGGTQRLTKIAGAGVAKRLILSGELVSGEEALQLGIAQDLAEPGEAFDVAMKLARAVSQAPRSTVAAIKRCIDLAPSAAGFEAEISGTLAAHHEPKTKALMSAFLARGHKKTVAV